MYKEKEEWGESTVIKVIRWIIYIPVSLVLTGLFLFLIFLFWKWLYFTFQAYFIYILIFIGGILWRLQKWVIIILSSQVIRICPSIIPGAIIFGILTILNNVLISIEIFKINELGTAGIILLIIPILLITFHMLFGAYIAVEEYD